MNIWKKCRSTLDLRDLFFNVKISLSILYLHLSVLIDFCFDFFADRSHLGQAKHKGYIPPESRKSNFKAPKVQSNTTSELSRGHLSKR